MKKKLELYIHIPFCIKKCKYCDFLSGPSDEETKQAYVKQLIKEIRAQSKYYKDYQVSTIFIGGGTPSVLSGSGICDIMSAIYENFIVEASAEISIECNPGSVDAEKLGYYKQSGINRISIGLQSADNKELKLLGRIHTYEEFLDTYQKVRECGFDNVNIDLMSAIPAQSFSSYKTTLKKVVMLKPEHISAYSLILEEGTPFYEYFSTKEGKKHLPTEEVDRQMYKFTKEYLAKNGYERYEISNYAKKGRECRHNIGYWTGVEYLGLGLGASSMAMDRRFHVERDMKKYLNMDFSKDLMGLYQDLEELSEIDKMEEFMFLGLRLTKGVSSSEFFGKFGLNMFKVFEKTIERNTLLKFLEYKQPYLYLTDRGLDLSNRIMSEFLFDRD